MIRETLEETRWDFQPSYISGIYRWLNNNGETYLRFCFVGDVTTEHKDRKLDAGIERAVWLSEQQIKDKKNLRSSLVLKSIEDYIRGNKYPLNLIQDIK